MKKVYIFDIDGTLTEPRQKINEEFIEPFIKFCADHTVFLATGSDFPKVKEQLTQDILTACMGVFVCMGNELRVNDEVIYTRKLKLPADVVDWLYLQLHNTKYPKHKLFTQNFEYRAGMLNFSVLGRDATQEIREDYHLWDSIEGERLFIARRFNENFSEYNLEAVIGGQISIDIQEKGKDKGQIYDYLSMYDHKTFFGDKCEPGGNDFSLYKKCEKSFTVHGWRDTLKILNDLMRL